MKNKRSLPPAPVKSSELKQLLPQEEAFRRIANLALKGDVIDENDKISPVDVADYCEFRISGGLRDACLAVDLAIRSGKAFEMEVRTKLLERWKQQTVFDLFNTGRNIIPWLRERGLLNYRDPHNLRMQIKLLKDQSHPAHSSLVEAVSRNASQAELKRLREIHSRQVGFDSHDDDRYLPYKIGSEFEGFIEKLLNEMYPAYSWNHLGRTKSEERGLDFFASPFDISKSKETIGVQVKCHKALASPSEQEWLKFLAGCFTRRVQHAIFITTGRLTGSQHREAQESQIITVVEGLTKINKLAQRHQIPPFEI